MKVSQQQKPFDWPVNMVGSIEVKGIGVGKDGKAKPWRLLRAAFQVQNSGETGLQPYVQLLDGGGKLLGEWWCLPVSGSGYPIPAQVVASVTYDTGHFVRSAGSVASSSVSVARVPIPPDLIVMEQHTLRFGVDGATPAEIDVQETVPGSPLLLTILVED